MKIRNTSRHLSHHKSKCRYPKNLLKLKCPYLNNRLRMANQCQTNNQKSAVPIREISWTWILQKFRLTMRKLLKILRLLRQKNKNMMLRSDRK